MIHAVSCKISKTETDNFSTKALHLCTYYPLFGIQNLTSYKINIAVLLFALYLIKLYVLHKLRTARNSGDVISRCPLISASIKHFVPQFLPLLSNKASLSIIPSSLLHDVSYLALVLQNEYYHRFIASECLPRTYIQRVQIASAD